MSDNPQRLQAVAFDENYSSSSSSLLRDFYVPALANAHAYDRAAGYFSSAIFALAPAAFGDFIERGGRMRLLCSPHLSEADAEAILRLPESHRPSPLDVAVDSLTAMNHGSPSQVKAVKCMRALIDAGVLEVRFVTVGKSGLYHEKIGVFTDLHGDRMSFSGSANETAAAWSGTQNHEGIEVFPEWLDEGCARRCARHADQFDETWNGLRRNLRVTKSEDARSIIQEHVPAEPLAAILDELRQSLVREELNFGALSLRSYQEDVLRSWQDDGYRGVVAFATGGGKTRTALEAVRRWISGGKPALILVPSELLHQQWAAEIAGQISGAAVLLAGAGHGRDRWSRRLSDYTRDDQTLGARIVLATYQTAATDTFLSLLRHGGHLLVVGDEVHRVGARDTRGLLTRTSAGARLGLSATPERFGDPEGTAAITAFFGRVLSPAFTLRDALDAGVLVPYDYYFETCALTVDEQQSWTLFTERVGKEIARNKGEVSDYALHLLRQRARITKRAHGKSALARRILAEEYKPGDRWLIYCGDVEHLREVRSELEGLELNLLEYHSNDEGDHGATLQFFQNRGGVLLAIKCLDEGIDIPMINRALILASSTNPREYIQRRGRVLRRSPGKFSAHLFDVLVTGEDGKAITPSEVVRAMEFARDARNIGPEIYLNELLPEGMSRDGFDVEDD